MLADKGVDSASGAQLSMRGIDNHRPTAFELRHHRHPG